MNSRRGSKRRRARTRDLSPTGDSDRVRMILTCISAFAVLGMVVLYGGTQFWASVPFWAVLLGVLIFHQSLAIRNIRRGGPPIRLPAGVFPWSMVCVYILLRAVLQPRVPYQTWTALYQVGLGLMVYILFADLGLKRQVRGTVWGLVIVTGILQAMWAIVLHLEDSNMVLWLPRPENYGMRASGTFICPNHFAHYLQMACICAVSTFLIPRVSIALRLVAGFSLIWMVPALMLSQSRAGLLGLLVGAGGMMFLKMARRGWKRAVVGMGGVACAGAGVLASIWLLYPPFSERIQEGTQGNIRFSEFWPDTWSMIRGEGFWGVGPGVFRHTFDAYREHFSRGWIYLEYAHNEYLHILAEYGWIFAALIFGAIGFWTVRWLRQSFTVSDEKDAMIPVVQLGLLGSSLAHAVFDFNLHITANILVLIMLLGVLEGNAMLKQLRVPRPLSRNLSFGLFGMTLVVALMLIPVSVKLFMGSVAEYQMDLARKENRTDDQSHYAALMRKWTPHHWRGWNELGLENRVQATFQRQPELREDTIRKSREAYRKALRLNEGNQIARMGLVELAVLEGDIERALSEINMLQEQTPFDAAVHIRKGILLQDLERYEESLEVFRKARRMRNGRDEQIELNIRYLRRKLKQSQG